MNYYVSYRLNLRYYIIYNLIGYNFKNNENLK